MQQHKYKQGDIVGICADCMADCEILKCVPKVEGKSLLYEAKAVSVHHPNPSESFFGKNKIFLVKEKQIVVKLK